VLGTFRHLRRNPGPAGGFYSLIRHAASRGTTLDAYLHELCSARRLASLSTPEITSVLLMFRSHRRNGLLSASRTSETSFSEGQYREISKSFCQDAKSACANQRRPANLGTLPRELILFPSDSVRINSPDLFYMCDVRSEEHASHAYNFSETTYQRFFLKLKVYVENAIEHAIEAEKSAHLNSHGCRFSPPGTCLGNVNTHTGPTYRSPMHITHTRAHGMARIIRLGHNAARAHRPDSFKSV